MLNRLKILVLPSFFSTGGSFRYLPPTNTYRTRGIRLFSDLNTSGPEDVEKNTDDDIQFHKVYSITGSGRRNASSIKTNTGHELHTDIPKQMGGTDSAPQPVEHLLSALVGCTQATAVFVGRSMKPRINIDRLEFDLHAHRDERGALNFPIEENPPVPSRLLAISGVITVFPKLSKNQGQISEQELAVLKEQTETRCPVANMMISSGCNMDVEWVLSSDKN